MSLPSRRDVLRACGVGVGALTGCSGRDDSPDATTSETTRTATRTTEETTTDEPTTEQTTTEHGRSECLPASLPTEGWPLPDRDPANTNYAPSAVGPTEKPSVRWKWKAEQPDVENYIGIQFTNPAVAGDRLFVGKALKPGTMRPMPDGNALNAHDRASGEHVWSYPMEKEAPESVAATDDAVYVTTEETVHAVERHDGTRRWRLELGTAVDGIVPADGRIYVATETWSESDTRVGAVTALRPDGTEEWTSAVGAGVRTRPAVADGTVFVGDDDGVVTALGAADGRERWSKSLGETGPHSYPSVDDLAVTDCAAFANVDGDLVALSHDGVVQWRADGEYTALSIDGASAYVGTGEGLLRVLSADDGAVEWETLLGERGDGVGGIHEDPVVTDDAVFVANRSDHLHSSDAATGTERWKLKIDVQGRSGKPVVADEQLFLSVWSHLIAIA